MRIGINLPTKHRDETAPTVAELMSFAGMVERLGFDGIWMGDTVARWNTTGIDSLQWLLAAAAGTQRIELGTAVLVVPLRYPVELAQRILSLYALSGGRFTCAVGSGSLPLDFVAVGVEHSERFRLFNEGVTTIKKLLEGGTVGTADLHPWPDVAGRPPIVIAAWYNGPWIKRAAHHFDGWVASGLNSTFGELKAGLKRFRDEGGKRALVATVGVNLDAASPPLTDETNFNLRCPVDEATERVARLADLGFDDLLLTNGTSSAVEDLTEERLLQILSLKPTDGSAPRSDAPSPASAPHPRAQDPVCRRYIDLVTMTSPTSSTISTVEQGGQTYYFCSESCKAAFEAGPERYLNRK
jgi:YHS domain-containing protein